MDVAREQTSPSGPLAAAARLSAVAGAGVAAATVLATLGSAGWLFELLSHFPLQYAFLLAAMISVLVIARRRRVAVVLLPFLIWNVVLVTPEYFGAAHASAPEDANVKVVFANVLGKNRELDRVVRYLRDSDPDVAVVAELRPALLEKLREAFPEYRIVAKPDQDNFGIGVLVRGEAAQARIVGDRAFPFVEATIVVGGERVHVLGIHPPPPMSPSLRSVRDRLLDSAADWARKRNGHVVVVGDFNTTPWSPDFDRVLAGGALRDSRVGFGVQPSWPASQPWALRIPIDHVLVGPTLRVLARDLGPEIGSDHLPVEARLTIAGGSPETVSSLLP